MVSDRVQSVSVEELLSDLADDNPAPSERWIQRDAFDPMHGMKEIRAAERRGFIEISSDGDLETLQMRFTAKGRAALEARSNV